MAGTATVVQYREKGHWLVVDGGRRRTIADVARHAGVSLSTVSRVMNGNPTVDPAMAERVREAAEALNYAPSPLARSLVLRRTQTVGVVVPDLGNPTFQEILRGISRAAARDGYHVLIADSAEVVTDERALAVATRSRTDGVILCAPRMPDDALTALLPELQPVVLINREPRSGTPGISVDYRGGLLDLLQHLYDLGHRHLVYLAGNPSSSSNSSRLAALAEFRRLQGDVVIDELDCGVGFQDGADAAYEVITGNATGVLAFNDLVAMGLLGAVQKRGVAVPEELSIVGFDGIPFAAFTSPPLTTATVPAAAVGSASWGEMSKLLSGAPSSDSMSMLPSLEVRESIGPVPGRVMTTRTKSGTWPTISTWSEME